MSNSDIHSAMVSGAVENGIRFAGSTHVYDALFLTDAPDMLLDLFPGSGLGYAPGVGFYGIRVSHTATSGLTEDETRRIDFASVDLGSALADVVSADVGGLAELFRERARAFTADAVGGEGE